MQKLILKIWQYQDVPTLKKTQALKLDRLLLPKRTRIYDQKYIISSRKKPDTLVVDLDGTLLILSKETEKTYLRISLFDVLKKLKKDKKVRLVLWSAANREYVKSKLLQYPKLIMLFDEVICAENYRIHPEIVSPELVKYEAKKLKRFHRKLLKKIKNNDDIIEKFKIETLARDINRAIKFRYRFDEGKNLALVNYKLLIDNAPSIRTQAGITGHNSLHIPTIDWNYITPINIPRILKFEQYLDQIYPLVIQILDHPEDAMEITKKFQKKLDRLTRPTKLYGKIFFRRKYV